jgi:hypothetical protein
MGDPSIIFNGLVEAEGRTRASPRRAGSSGICNLLLWCTPSLVKIALRRQSAGFEPQRAMSFGKNNESPQSTRRNRPSLNGDPTLCATFSTACGVGELPYYRSRCRPPLHQNWGRAGATCSRFARDGNEPGSQLGENNFPDNGLVELPRRDTRALSPAGVFKGNAPLYYSGAEEQTAFAISPYALYACLFSLQIGSIHYTRPA